MSKQVLSIEQMQHLQELGLDTSNASAFWCNPDRHGDWELSFTDSHGGKIPQSNKYDEFCPAYTLQDVLDALPKVIKDENGTEYWLQIEMMNSQYDDWRVSYKSIGWDESPLGYFQAFQLIDAAVRMLVLCAGHGYVETNKNG